MLSPPMPRHHDKRDIASIRPMRPPENRDMVSARRAKGLRRLSTPPPAPIRERWAQRRQLPDRQAKRQRHPRPLPRRRPRPPTEPPGNRRPMPARCHGQLPHRQTSGDAGRVERRDRGSQLAAHADGGMQAPGREGPWRLTRGRRSRTAPSPPFSGSLPTRHRRKPTSLTHIAMAPADRIAGVRTGSAEAPADLRRSVRRCVRI